MPTGRRKKESKKNKEKKETQKKQNQQSRNPAPGRNIQKHTRKLVHLGPSLGRGSALPPAILSPFSTRQQDKAAAKTRQEQPRSGKIRQGQARQGSVLFSPSIVCRPCHHSCGKHLPPEEEKKKYTGYTQFHTLIHSITTWFEPSCHLSNIAENFPANTRKHRGLSDLLPYSVAKSLRRAPATQGRHGITSPIAVPKKRYTTSPGRACTLHCIPPPEFLCYVSRLAI